jgi:hypothetical protein
MRGSRPKLAGCLLGLPVLILGLLLVAAPPAEASRARTRPASRSSKGHHGTPPSSDQSCDGLHGKLYGRCNA